MNRKYQLILLILTLLVSSTSLALLVAMAIREQWFSMPDGLHPAVSALIGAVVCGVFTKLWFGDGK